MRKAGGFAARLALFCVVVAAPLTPAFAYLGPGSGLTALGSLVALFGALGLGILGFLWYPVKRLFRRLQSSRRDTSEPGDNAD